VVYKDHIPANEQRAHREFMAQAIDLCLGNIQEGGGPFAAIIVKGGQVIAEGANRVIATNDPTAHAEMQAIRIACKKLGDFELKDCDLYTTCEPCPMCLGAIYWSRIGRVFFGSGAADAAKIGFDDAFIYKEIRRAHAKREIPMVSLMREESLEAFRAWEMKPDKVAY
jgi:guanine deaminase